MAAIFAMLAPYPITFASDSCAANVKAAQQTFLEWVANMTTVKKLHDVLSEEGLPRSQPTKLAKTATLWNNICGE